MSKATKKVTKKPLAQKKTVKSVGRPKTVKSALKPAKKAVKLVAKAPKKAKKTTAKPVSKSTKTAVKKTLTKKVTASKTTKPASVKKIAVKKIVRAKKSVSLIAEIQALVIKAKKDLDQRIIALQKQTIKIDNKITKARKAYLTTQAALAVPATAKKTAKLQATLKEISVLVEELSSEAQNVIAAQQIVDGEYAILNGLHFTAPTALKETAARSRSKKELDVEKASVAHMPAAVEEKLEAFAD